MSSPFKPVEPRNPIAAYVDREFVKGLIDQPSPYITPNFSDKSNGLLGVNVISPATGDVYEAEVGDVIVQHPGGNLEVIDWFKFHDKYQYRD